MTDYYKGLLKLRNNFCSSQWRVYVPVIIACSCELIQLSLVAMDVVIVAKLKHSHATSFHIRTAWSYS
jgi:hypothetical protein